MVFFYKKETEKVESVARPGRILVYVVIHIKCNLEVNIKLLGKTLFRTIRFDLKIEYSMCLLKTLFSGHFCLTPEGQEEVNLVFFFWI